MFIHVVSADYIDGYRIEVEFNNGRKGVADLSESLDGKVFEPLQDVVLFQRFEVDGELGTVRWFNDVDFAPEYLYFLAFRDVPELQDQFELWGYLPNKSVISV